MAFAFDIYGEPLRRGHCEVHPAMHEEYPCSLCLSEASRHRQEQEAYDAEMSRQYEADCREMEAAEMLDRTRLFPASEEEPKS